MNAICRVKNDGFGAVTGKSVDEGVRKQIDEQLNETKKPKCGLKNMIGLFLCHNQMQYVNSLCLVYQIPFSSTSSKDGSYYID